MNTAIALGRTKTFLDKITGCSSQASNQAAIVWQALRPRLTLSRDMASDNRRARLAKNVIAANLPRPTKYLEIGSFEGASLAFLHSLLKGNIKATCIDPFQNYDEIPATDMSEVEQLFRANMKALDIHPRILLGQSIQRLPELIANDETFDLIYIDGSHIALDVMADAVMCWRLLAPSGLMIFDDYRWCKAAINAFVKLVKNDIEIADVAGQVFLRRL